MRLIRRLVVLLVITFAVVPAAEAKLPGLLTQETARGFYVRPAFVGFTGDGTGYVGGSDGYGRLGDDADWGHVPWIRWTTRVARGVGVVWLNDCDPDCADGSYTAHSGRVRAYRVRNHHFTRLVIRSSYGGHAILDRRKLRRYGSFYEWGFLP